LVPSFHLGKEKRLRATHSAVVFLLLLLLSFSPPPNRKGNGRQPQGEGGCISHHPDLLLYPPTCGKWGAAGGWKRKRRGTPKSSWAQWESSEQEGKWQSTTACHDKRTTTTTTTRFFFLLFNELCTEKWS
jgi:hypothetical protein